MISKSQFKEEKKKKKKGSKALPKKKKSKKCIRLLELTEVLARPRDYQHPVTLIPISVSLK